MNPSSSSFSSPTPPRDVPNLSGGLTQEASNTFPPHDSILDFHPLFPSESPSQTSQSCPSLFLRLITSLSLSKGVETQLKNLDWNWYNKILHITLSILGYYIIAISLSVYNKWLFGKETHHFPFPLFATMIQ